MPAASTAATKSAETLTCRRREGQQRDGEQRDERHLERGQRQRRQRRRVALGEDEVNGVGDGAGEGEGVASGEASAGVGTAEQVEPGHREQGGEERVPARGAPEDGPGHERSQHDEQAGE